MCAAHERPSACFAEEWTATTKKSLVAMAGNVLWTSVFNKPDSQSQDLTRQRIVQEERCGRRSAEIIPGPIYDQMVRGTGGPALLDPWAPTGAARKTIQPPRTLALPLSPHAASKTACCFRLLHRALASLTLSPLSSFVLDPWLRSRWVWRHDPARPARAHGQEQWRAGSALCPALRLRSACGDAAGRACGRRERPWHQAMGDPGHADAGRPRHPREPAHRARGRPVRRQAAVGRGRRLRDRTQRPSVRPEVSVGRLARYSAYVFFSHTLSRPLPLSGSASRPSALPRSLPAWLRRAQ